VSIADTNIPSSTTHGDFVTFLDTVKPKWDWVNSIGEIKWFSLGPFIQFHRIHTCLAPKIQRFGCRQFLDV